LPKKRLHPYDKPQWGVYLAFQGKGFSEFVFEGVARFPITAHFHVTRCGVQGPKEVVSCPKKNPMSEKRTAKVRKKAVKPGLPMTAAAFRWSMPAAAGWSIHAAVM
jgi:hypothetical protein